MKNEKNLDNFILLYILIAYAIVYFLIIANFIPGYASIISFGVIAVITIISYFIYGFQKNKVEGVKFKIFKEIGVGVFAYFILIFTLGLFTGYYKNFYSTAIISIIKNALVPLLTMITLELFRYMYMRSNKMSKFSIFLGTLFLSIIDCLLLLRELIASTTLCDDIQVNLSSILSCLLFSKSLILFVFVVI